MQFRIYTLIAFCSLVATVAVAQSQFAPLNDDYYHLIDRFEIKRNRLSEDFHLAMKPFHRKAIMNLVDSIEADRAMPLNDRDFFNLEYLKNDSWEWSPDRTPMSANRFSSRLMARLASPITNRFYKKQLRIILSQSSSQSVYFPNLNGVRFIAAFSVLIHHIEQVKQVFKVPHFYDNHLIKSMGKLGVAYLAFVFFDCHFGFSYFSSYSPFCSSQRRNLVYGVSSL